VIVAGFAVPADIRAGTDGGDMGARADAVAVKAATRAHRCDMRAGMHAPVAHTGAGADHMTNMTACGDAVLANARAGANTADMGARADAMLVDMGADADAQDMDTQVNRIGSGDEQCQGTKRGGKDFQIFMARSCFRDTYQNGQRGCKFRQA
jgi:hypothetical protein